MDKAEFIQKIQAIGTCEDDVERRSLLADLQKEAEADYDSISTLTSEKESLAAEVDRLQEHNYKLFAQVGLENNPPPPDSSGTEEKKLKFEDLFNEKGEIK